MGEEPTTAEQPPVLAVLGMLDRVAILGTRATWVVVGVSYGHERATIELETAGSFAAEQNAQRGATS